LDSLGFPKERQRIILNRYSRFAGNLRPEDVVRRLAREVDYVVPYQKKLLIASNLGQPYVLSAATWWGIGKVFAKMVQDLGATPAEPGPARNGVAVGATAGGPTSGGIADVARQDLQAASANMARENHEPH
jgi:pilus assembly protein CpaE